MERYEKRKYQDGSKVQPRDLNDMPRRATESIRSTHDTRVNRLGDNVTIKSAGGSDTSVASGLRIAKVLVLPSIPSSGARMVFWTSEGTGTGDDQIWVAYAGQTAYTPMQRYTTKSGVPV
jgi:hypothetical protein